LNFVIAPTLSKAFLTSNSKADKNENTNCFVFLVTCPSQSHVSLTNETDEAGSWNFVSDGEQNIPDDKNM